jgi:protein MAK11
MTTKRELGIITRSEGLVTCMEFFKTTHLFCGTEKGEVLVWKTHHWEQLPNMKGHTGRINSLSVHPSGVLALTTSRDKTLKLWDLAKGIVAHTNKLEQEADFVQWAPDGKHYIVTSDKRIVLYSAEGKKLRTMSEQKRIIAVKWLNHRTFVTGGEDRKLFIWDLHSDDPLKTLTGFKNRIKGIDVIPKTNMEGQQYPYIVTISSDERIRVFDADRSLDTPVCSVYQDVRFICLTVAPVPIDDDAKSTKASKKQKNQARRSAEDSEEEQAEVVPVKRPTKQFKVIEYQESQPIRKGHLPKAPAQATPTKSILKKAKVPEPEVFEMDVTEKEPVKKTKVVSRKAPSHVSRPSGKSVVRKFSGKKTLSSLFE